MKNKINWDALGITTAILCAIHCAVLPLFLAALPLFGINIIDNHVFEYIMIAIAFLIGLYALYHGYKWHHHKKLPLIIFCAGMLFLVLKQAIHEYRIIFLIPAVVFIVVAHFLNYRYCRQHNHAHTYDCNHDHY